MGALLVLGAPLAFCQCPALTGGGNFPAAATVQVYAVQNLLGTPDVQPVVDALNSRNRALGSGITFVTNPGHLPPGQTQWDYYCGPTVR